MATAPTHTAPLNTLDELYLHLDREEDPWSVQLEIQVEGAVDAARLEAAIRDAALRHPLARARLADTRGLDVRYRWEIFDELEEVPLEIAEDAKPAEVRERLYGSSPELDRPGPFKVVVADDTVMLNLHHAAGDGISALRLMGSIVRAYAGVEDPLPGVDPLEVRDIAEMTRPDSLDERVKQGRHLLARGFTPPERIDPAGGADRPGYGFELLELGPSEVERLRERRRGDATVNDVLLAGLAVTAREWNGTEDGGPLSITMPVNLRPSEWRFEVVGNYASYVGVRLPPEEQGDFDTTLE